MSDRHACHTLGKRWVDGLIPQLLVHIKRVHHDKLCLGVWVVRTQPQVAAQHGVYGGHVFRHHMVEIVAKCEKYKLCLFVYNHRGCVGQIGCSIGFKGSGVFHAQDGTQKPVNVECWGLGGGVVVVEEQNGAVPYGQVLVSMCGGGYIHRGKGWNVKEHNLHVLNIHTSTHPTPDPPYTSYLHTMYVSLRDGSGVLQLYPLCIPCSCVYKSPSVMVAFSLFTGRLVVSSEYGVGNACHC